VTQIRQGDRGGDVAAIKASDHSIAPFESNVGCTLVSGATYYFIVGDADSTYKSVHFKWDAAIIVTLTPWGCDQPLDLLGMGGSGTAFPHVGTDTPNDSTAKGDWLLINPASAVLYTTSDDGTTGGNTVTNGTTSTIAGGTAGGVIYDFGNVPTKRIRFRAVVGGTGGKLRCTVHGKE
jgi:hypothetical protein